MSEEPIRPEVVPYKPAVSLEAAELAGLLGQVEAAKRDAMRQDVDYGVIPHTGDRPTLLKPGAERLLLLFGMTHDMQMVEVERKDEAPFRVTIRCVVSRGDLQVSSSFGTADYDEARFYRSPAGGKAEYRAPWNTLVKMAQKRALVGAALQATGSSGLFTQDLEDEAPSEDATKALALNWISNYGGGAIKKLDKSVAEELKRRLPWSKDWTVDNWILALIEAGRIDCERERQMGG